MRTAPRAHILGYLVLIWWNCLAWPCWRRYIIGGELEISKAHANARYLFLLAVAQLYALSYRPSVGCHAPHSDDHRLYLSETELQQTLF